MIRRISIVRSPAGQVVGTTGVVLLTQAIGGIILARVLGPGDRGLLAALVLWAATASDIADLGIRHATSFWAASGKPAQALRMLRSVLPVLSLVGLAIYAAFVGLSGRWDELPVAAVVVMGIWVGVQLLHMVVQRLQQGLHNMGAFNTMRLFAEVGPTIGYATVAVLGLLTVATGAAAITLFMLIATAYGVRLARPVWKQAKQAHVGDEDKRAFRSYSLRSWMTVLAVRSNGTIDLLILTLLAATSVDIGLYSVAITSTGVIAVLIGSLGFDLFPRIAGLAPDADGRPLLRKYIAAAFGTATMAAAVFWLVADWLIPLVYGDDFATAVEPARILLIGVVAATVARVAGDGLAGMGFPGRQAIAQAVGAVSTATLIFVLGADSLQRVAVASSTGFLATAVLMSAFVAVAAHRSYEPSTDRS